MKYYFKCPECDYDESFFSPKEDTSGVGCLLFLLGGFLPALIYSDATCRRIQCAKCGYIFRQPALPRTALSSLVLWIVLVILFFCAFIFIMISYPEMYQLIPQSQTLSDFEAVISENPRAVVFGIFPMILLILIPSVLASWFSNFNARRELKKICLTKPKTRRLEENKHQQ